MITSYTKKPKIYVFLKLVVDAMNMLYMDPNVL